MASSGPSPPVQDPMRFMKYSNSVWRPTSRSPPSSAPIAPFQSLPRFESPINAATSRGLVLAPPIRAWIGSSPCKVDRPSRSLPKPISTKAITIAPPAETPFPTDSPLKRPRAPTFSMTGDLRSRPALFTTFQSMPSSSGRERASAGPYGSEAAKGAAKRALADADPPRERHAKRARVEEPQPQPQPQQQQQQQQELALPVHIPSPEEMAPVEDDGNKPQYSYAMLIGMSILRAPERRLTLAQIYKWIAHTFLYYRTVETGWQNSIRHNLSLNKAFVKQERPKGDPGKGNYWAIAPGAEAQFLKERPGRRPLSLGPVRPLQPSPAYFPPPPPARPGQPTMMPSASLQHGPYSMGAAAAAAAAATAAVPISLPLATAAAPSTTVTTTTTSVPRAPRRDLSSDATISATDEHPPERDEPGSDRAVRVMRSSPPPMHSSPPPPPAPPSAAADPLSSSVVACRRSTVEDTPPSTRRLAVPSSWSRKHQFRSMNDSGYFSSFDSSSALRPNAVNAFLTAEAEVDRPRTSTGRAEEELARMRRNSHDSPGRLRPSMGPPTAAFAGGLSSSPTRSYQTRLKMPRTPLMEFKVPPKPALPSVSPTTNLLNHRKRMVALLGGSPFTGAARSADTIPVSPAFQLDAEHEATYSYNDSDPATLANEFNIFSDSPTRVVNSILYGSPEKRSPKYDGSPLKRPRMDRARTTASILAEVTGNGAHPGYPAAFLGLTPTIPFPSLRSVTWSGSPTKSPTRRPSSSMENVGAFDDLVATDLPDLDLDELWGLPDSPVRPPGGPRRPTLGRSTSHPN